MSRVKQTAMTSLRVIAQALGVLWMMAISCGEAICGTVFLGDNEDEQLGGRS